MRKCLEEMQAATKRQLADPADLAADLQRGFKLEPGVQDEAQMHANTHAGSSEFAELEEVLVAQSKKRHRSS